MHPILAIAFACHVLYCSAFLLFNSMRLFKPYDNEMLFNPVAMVREFIKDMRTPKD
jgi:hypothetical protein